MILNADDLLLKLTNKTDTDLQSITENSTDLENMSETRIYPSNMPVEMLFRIEKDKEVIGEIKFTRIRWFNRKAELSIIIKKEYQQKGYGKKAMKQIMNFAFNKMNLHRLEAEIIEYNKVSIALIEKLGFKKEGTFRQAKYSQGKYWDIFRYGILKDEF